MNEIILEVDDLLDRTNALMKAIEWSLNETEKDLTDSENFNNTQHLFYTAWDTMNAIREKMELYTSEHGNFMQKN